MDGVLVINKPSGMTSHDVVTAVRRMLGERRIGHTGTLDPLATGVLVLCVGRATRIAQYLEAGVKEYRAVMRLGVITDTLDAEGKVLEERSYQPPSREAVESVLQSFRGEILQQPPVYSAIKVGGVPSYKLARKGIAKPLKPRQVTIWSLEMTSYEDPFITLSVRCSKGVYIRTLCADIGKALGMGARLEKLERTRSGTCSLDQAVTLEQAASLAASDPERLVLSMDQALADLPLVKVTEDDSLRVLYGNRIPVPDSRERGDSLCRIHGPAGQLIALARTVEQQLRPVVVFS